MPQWLIWLILVIVAILIIWFFWNRSQESKAAAERAEAERRRAASAAAARSAAMAPAPREPLSERAETRFQDAADTAMATDLPAETARLDAAAADLAAARREAEAAASRLAEQADATLAEVRQARDEPTNIDEPIDVETVLIEERRGGPNAGAAAAAASGGDSVPPGAVRGDGGRDCPPIYPIKANAHSMLYHTTESASYNQTIPEFCFSSESAAEAAGFTSSHRH